MRIFFSLRQYLEVPQILINTLYIFSIKEKQLLGVHVKFMGKKIFAINVLESCRTLLEPPKVIGTLARRVLASRGKLARNTTERRWNRVKL